MEVQHPVSVFAHQPSQTDVMESNMDIDLDLDIDLPPVDSEQAMEIAIDQTDPTPDISGIISADLIESSLVSAAELAPNKIHIRGVDDLTTLEIKTWSFEHVNVPAERLEWIDDSSANLVYGAPTIASAALLELTRPLAGNIDLSPREFRAAKPCSSHQNAKLQIRMAFTTDRKRPRAHENSRFYLLNPEHDPREKRRRERGRSGNGDQYRRRTYSDEEDRRRKRSDLNDGFDASMYDDNGPSGARETAASSPISRSRREVDSYRPPRDRSASPVASRDKANSQHRRRTPQPSRRPQQNSEKELFPLKNTKPEGKDLFSNQLLATKVKKDLFPNKLGSGRHRRSDAFDAADETADLFAGKMTVPFMDGANDGRLQHVVFQADHDREQQTFGERDNAGLNIRGASLQGFSIKGGAATNGTNKELFPGKSNASKELFAGKLKGRGRPRTKAADLFN